MWQKSKPLDISEFTPEELLHKGYVKAVDLLYRQPYTTVKLNYKLKSLGYPTEIVDKIINKLIGEKFLNDEYYCNRRMVAYLERGENSLRDIKFKLLQKGFSSQDINLAQEEVLADYPQYEYKACLKLLRIKYPRGMEADNYQKALAYLARKGFDSYVANEAIQTYLNNE